MDLGLERSVRQAMFTYLEFLDSEYSRELPWTALYDQFEYQGELLRLIHRGQGIWKPAALDAALTVTTAADSPYTDSFDAQGLLEYRYATGSGAGWQNQALRLAYEHALPLAHLQGVGDSRYVATWPVYIVADEPAAGLVRIAVDDLRRIDPSASADLAEAARRAYSTVLARRRLHQARFRHQVLRAYRTACGICRLDGESLLDAAHILPDGHHLGDPVVANGISLCTIHHRAFDRSLIGIRPDCVVQVNQRVLEKADGPMLRHGIQDFHGTPLRLPKRAEQAPDPERLEIRFRGFLAAQR